MDKASWSRIINGQQEFPASQIKPLRLLTGNQAVLQWLAFEDGCELRPLRSELEQQIEAKDAQIAELQGQLHIITNFIKQTRTT